MSEGARQLPLAAVELDIRGVEHVVAVLQHGLTLARIVAERLGHVPSVCVAYVPMETDQSVVYEFECGGVTSSRAGGVAGVGAILKELEACPSCIALGETATYRNELDTDTNWKDRFLAYGDERYLKIAPPDCSPELVADLLALIDESWTSTVSILDVPPTLRDVVGQVGGHILEHLALQPRAVLVRAYDGESYLLWRRTDVGGQLPSA